MTRCALLLVLAALAGCGGQARDSMRASPTPGLLGTPGELVEIGGGRSLFAHCVGHGDPTIVLQAGFGATGFSWRAVQPRLGRIARTCAYDRAGSGSSVAVAGVHDARDEIADVRALLRGVGARPPYVLVGQSYGGLVGRVYAEAFPAEVAGIVQVDAKGRDQVRRLMAVWPRSQAPGLRRRVARGVVDGIDLAAGERLGRGVSDLGDVPLVVVTAGRNRDFLEVPRGLGSALATQWMALQDELAGLSADSIHVVAVRSGHVVQQPGEQPSVVARATEAVVTAVREHAPLPPCPRLFGGRGVRCAAAAG